jgi:hypothetical protein
MQTISRERRCPLMVAAPFLGSNGGKLLRLKRGDVLIVALTEANSRNGSVCPAEIGRLQRKGVHVFLAPDLHAKVMMCGGKAVVGSANLSQTSFSYLDEAAVLTTDATVVKDVRNWFRERMAEAISPEWLAICGKAYKPPRGGVGNMGKRRVRHSSGRRVWFMSLRMTTHPENEAAAAERGAKAAERELSDTVKFQVTRVRWSRQARFLDAIRKGDSVIQVMRDGDSRYVEEAARFLGIRRTKSVRGAFVSYLYLECRRRPKTVPWSE